MANTLCHLLWKALDCGVISARNLDFYDQFLNYAIALENVTAI
jgi:hypothetical protein